MRIRDAILIARRDGLRVVIDAVDVTVGKEGGGRRVARFRRNRTQGRDRRLAGPRPSRRAGPALAGSFQGRFIAWAALGRHPAEKSDRRAAGPYRALWALGEVALPFRKDGGWRLLTSGYQLFNLGLLNVELRLPAGFSSWRSGAFNIATQLPRRSRGQRGSHAQRRLVARRLPGCGHS